ncbi:MAG: hypothetical protein DLM53_08915 [Candidatus Eremiobacter antarcticus]|nr:MAG: hypothetical protein DLM53_08915 [Candidatus Eremiobacter sp. RRmetagenome_bin22]
MKCSETRRGEASLLYFYLCNWSVMMSEIKTPSPTLDKLGQLSRKTMLGSLGAGALAVTAAMGLPATVLGYDISDDDILNFALNLEYLEAEFYTYATTGHGITGIAPVTGGFGKPGATVGGKMVSFSNALLQQSARELAYDEQQHVILLHQLIGSANAVAKPAINLNAVGVGFGNQLEFLLLARALEDTGVSAYAGAAPLLQSKIVLGYAARILGTEAEHAGNIRLQVAAFGVATKPLDALDVLPPPSGSHLFSVNAQALVAARTVQQVLAIVRPFFPNGLNGTIR